MKASPGKTVGGLVVVTLAIGLVSCEHGSRGALARGPSINTGGFPGAGHGGGSISEMSALGGASAGAGGRGGRADAGAGGVLSPVGSGGVAAGNGGTWSGSAAGAQGAPGGTAGAAARVHPASANYVINPAHDGTQPEEAIRTPLAKRWSTDSLGGVHYPLIADGRLFVAFTNGLPGVVAYELQTGAISWGPLSGNAIGGIAYDGGTLYGLDPEGIVSAWDGATGRPLWTLALTKQWIFDDPPVATGGLVYVNGQGLGGTVYAVDGATGALRWSSDYYGGSGAVTIGDDLLFETGGCQKVSAMNARTGQGVAVIHSTDCSGGGGGMSVYSQGRLWVQDVILGKIVIDAKGTPLHLFVAGMPAVHGGTAFYPTGGSSDTAVTAIDLATGAMLWSTSVKNACTPLAVAGRGHQVFVGTGEGALHELDELTGREVSVDATGRPSGPCWPLALAEGRLAYATAAAIAVY